MQNMTGKVAIVTGCSSGIGRATALAFSRDGIKTYATMRNKDDGDELLKIANKESIPLKVLELDVTKEETMDAAIKKIIAENEKIDILVNNAGYMVLGSFEDVDLKDFETQLKTDFIGPVLLMKKIIPIMRKQNSGENGVRGNIINVSSIAGKIPFAYASSYIASKFALEGISESISDEVSQMGIKINIIEPGVVKTKFMENTKITINKDGPYGEIVEQWNEMAEALFEVAKNMPEDVATKILGCINDNNSPLRVLVGEDAELFVDMHDQNAKEPEKFKKWFAKEMENMFLELRKR